MDGDTIVVEIEGVSEKVRLVGVDTPETVHPNKPVEHYGKRHQHSPRRWLTGKWCDWSMTPRNGTDMADYLPMSISMTARS